MGQETHCTVRLGGASSFGKARLESEDLRFRGSFRLTIPFTDIQALDTRDGALHIRFPDGEATFELGSPLAERWAEKIRNPRRLIDKLGVKPNQRAVVLGVMDAEFWAQLRERTLWIDEHLVPDADHIFLQADERSALAHIPSCRDHLRASGGLWVIAPKGQRHITELDVLLAGRAAGLTDSKVVKFSETHTGHRFVVPVAGRRGPHPPTPSPNPGRGGE